MKTIFISSFNPFILRNILVGDALKILKKQSGTRIIVFVPDYKAAFFKEQIGAENVIIEGLKMRPSSRQDIIFRFLDSSLANTSTLAVHKRVQLERGGRYLRFGIAWLLMKVFSHLKFFKNFIHYLDYLTISKDRFVRYFDFYHPQVVFATDVFNDDDAHLLAEAKSRGLQTVGMVRSWDNFTTKGFFRIKPDALIVHNEIIKGEAVRYGGLRPDRVFVSGIPQYDGYLASPRMPREEFFHKTKLDPARKLILFSPLGKRFCDSDWQIMEILKEFIHKGLIPPAQVLVRFTPNDEVSLGDFIPDKYFYIDRPGRQFQAGVFRDQELTEANMNWLADSLYHSDVIIAGGASIGIDAAIFGKPTIIFYFDGFSDKPYWESVRRFYRYSHSTPLVEMGAFRAARSAEELRQNLVAYLENSHLDKPAREQMLARQCWKLDGLSGKRIGNFLLQHLLKS